MTPNHFSKNYRKARGRFKAAAQSVGAKIRSYRVRAIDEQELTIDVAIVGLEGAPTVFTSSGVHGVEGFFGSAVQLAILKRLGERQPKSPVRHVLIHAVNPYGFSQIRRFNEDNVDLNRNFLTDPSGYAGAPQGYAELNSFLNPTSPPSRLEPVKLKAAWLLVRLGMQAIKQSVAGGQYEYPKGVFFGGHGPCQSTKTILDNCDEWIGSSQRVVHLDFHTGLGNFGAYKLLLTDTESPDSTSWYVDAFGHDCIEHLRTSAKTAYRSCGLFGDWMQEHFADREYRFVCAEFGTYGLIRVLSSIRAENRAHFYGDERSPGYLTAKAELLECFCPANAFWREQVIDASLRIVDQATQILRT